MIFSKSRPLISNILAAFLLKIPILYTTFLYIFFISSENFGETQLIVTIASIALPIITFCLYSGFGRYLYETEILLEIQLITTLYAIFGLFTVTFLCILIVDQITTQTIYLNFISKLVLVLCFSWTLDIIFQQISIKLEDMEYFNKVIIIKYMLVVLCAYCFIKFSTVDFKRIFLISECIGLVISVIFFIIRFKLYNAINKFNSKYFLYIFNFSTPLIFYTFGIVALSQSDRVVISQLLDISMVGLYAYVYNAASVITLCVNGILNSLLPKFYVQKKLELDNSIESLYFVLGLSNLLLILSAIFFYILNNFVNPFPYVSVASLSFLALVCLAPSFALQLLSRELQYEKRTTILSIGVLIGAVLNIGLNYLFIPHFGLKAAMYNTFVAIFVVYLLLLFFSKMRHKKAHLIIVITNCLILLLIYILFDQHNIFYKILGTILALATIVKSFYDVKKIFNKLYGTV